MRKVYVLALAMLMVMMVGVVSFADEIPAGSVSFDVKWTVEPRIDFYLAYGPNMAYFSNDALVFGDTAFSDYEFASRIANFNQAYFGVEDIHGEWIYAGVASNDWWVLEFNKPRLESDNDHHTTIPVYAKRYMYEWATSNDTETGWFSGNDKIKKDMGIYEMAWDMKVEFKNWHTRYGNYENTYTVTVTQF